MQDRPEREWRPTISQDKFTVLMLNAVLRQISNTSGRRLGRAGASIHERLYHFLADRGLVAPSRYFFCRAVDRLMDDMTELAVTQKSAEQFNDVAKASDSEQRISDIHRRVANLHASMARLTLTAPNYRELLLAIHASLKPSTYVEVGVSAGGSLMQANPDTFAVGIDPDPKFDVSTLPRNHKVFVSTSDDFFRDNDLKGLLDNKPLELAFVDGMHLFEFALRDFINLERYCTADSTIIVHDCYPIDTHVASRKRYTLVWCGDVWKLILCLKKYRPDLHVEVVPSPPSGLAVIRNLDPDSTVLADHLKEIYEEYGPMSYAVLGDDKASKLNLLSADEAMARDYLH